MPANGFTDWLERNMFTCPSKKWLAIDCPGCGLQRSLLALLKGDVALSWKLYPPTMFIIATMAMLVLHLIFQFRQGAAILKTLFIITVFIMAANYIYKIVNHQLI